MSRCRFCKPGRGEGVIEGAVCGFQKVPDAGRHGGDGRAWCWSRSRDSTSEKLRDRRPSAPAAAASQPEAMARPLFRPKTLPWELPTSDSARNQPQRPDFTTEIVIMRGIKIRDDAR